jgi:hypothetical protein
MVKIPGRGFAEEDPFEMLLAPEQRQHLAGITAVGAQGVVNELFKKRPVLPRENVFVDHALRNRNCGVGSPGRRHFSQLRGKHPAQLNGENPEQQVFVPIYIHALFTLFRPAKSPHPALLHDRVQTLKTSKAISGD